MKEIPFRPIQGKNDPRSLYLATRRFCRKKGIKVADPEYDSAINFAVFRALQTHRPDGNGHTARQLIHLCICYALRACGNVSDRLANQHRHDLAAAERGIRQPPTMPPIPLSDFEVLSFVAAHRHVAKAARLLGMTAYRLKLLLCEIQLRVREGIAMAPDPDILNLGEPGEDDHQEYGMSYHPAPFPTLRARKRERKQLPR
jgi:hypothetical protein